MSATALAAVIVNGVTDLAAIGAGTACVFRFADRLQITRAPSQPGERPVSPSRPDAGISAPTEARAGRETEFWEHRAAGKTVAEARELAGVPETTSRRYEKRRLAAQNGAGT